MYAADYLTSSEKAIKSLFDLKNRKTDKFISHEGKFLYWQHALQEHWAEICGANLARSCNVYKLSGNELHIRTANSLMANELYMMQGLFLQKINKFLGGNIYIKKMYFHTSGAIRRTEKKQQLEEQQAVPPVRYVRCPHCGAPMHDDLKVCSVCEREIKEETRRKVAELLRIQPWLRYEECCKYYKCDKILFSAVKDNIKNFFFEKVRNHFADEKECLVAVLLLTEKHPEELTEKIYENALEYLRRNSYVSASGSRLYGKKQ